MNITRAESEEAIAKLAELYPKCFFLDPQQRRPLKNGILADLQKDGAPFANEILFASVDWYQSHFGYLYSLETGAKRINLQGKDVGTVTATEAATAKNKIKEGREKEAEKRNANNAIEKRDAVATLKALHENRQISDDIIKKLDAPPMTVKTITTRKAIMPMADDMAPELAQIDGALQAANDVLLGEHDPTLKAVLVSAALGVVIKEAQRVIDSLSVTES